MAKKYSGTLSKDITEREIKHQNIIRRIAAEGIVLLINDGTLPLAKESTVSVYGGGALYTIKGGTGSGSVNNRNNVSILDGLRNAGFHISNDEWLSDYEKRYKEAREKWIKSIYDMSIPGDFFSLYTAHAGNPLQMPMGSEIKNTGCDTAIYVISRISGEGADRKNEKGDYYLSDVEEAELGRISECYKNLIVILNVGGIIDTSFTDRYHISALVLLSQAGMEGGNSLADVLSGIVNPSGRLTDTWAVNYSDYPCSDTFSHINGNLYEELYREGIFVGYRYFDSFDIKPRFPFGYGLSYTRFTTVPECVKAVPGYLETTVKVTNTGSLPGKDVIFVYASCPQGVLVKEKKRLIGFAKTGILLPGESCDITVKSDLHLLESYHSGISSYILEAGDYYIMAGDNTTALNPAATLKLNETLVMDELGTVCELLQSLKEFEPPRELIESWRSEYKIKFADAVSISLSDFTVKRKKACDSRDINAAGVYADLDEILLSKARDTVSKLTLEQKARLCCGTQSGKEAEFVGNAASTVPGAAGETTGTLKKEYDVDNMILADGPAGIRLLQNYFVSPETGEIHMLTGYKGLENRFFGTGYFVPDCEEYFQFCSALPIGTLLAQSFDEDLVKEAGALVGAEMLEFGITLWLAPGMNIHRNPLCGRNYEYYSEDPLVSGKMAGAITLGVQKDHRIGTTIKHYACNNQEDNRFNVNSVVSERALREIYLKGFEIAVRESKPLAIMTSYNKLNGYHTANSYDLCTVIAREEWGFAGIFMTDWTTTNNGNGSSAAKCIAVGNDLVMPGNDHDIKEIIDAVNKSGSQHISEEILNECCTRILYTIFKTHS